MSEPSRGEPPAAAADGGVATTKVAIIEDRREIRDGLQMLIDGTAGYRCTGTYRSMEDALAGIGSDVPNVVLVDIGLPGMSGIEGIALLNARHPDVLLLMLTVYDDDERIFDALCAGACGYLLKKMPPSQILDSVTQAVAGGAPMSPEVARRVIELFRQLRPSESADYGLTPHEVRLLQLVAEGHSYKSAAVQLKVTVKTISFHLQKIYGKLHVHSKSEAVSKGLRKRLIK